MKNWRENQQMNILYLMRTTIGSFISRIYISHLDDFQGKRQIRNIDTYLINKKAASKMEQDAATCSAFS